MPKTSNKLTVKQVAALTQPGTYTDGDGLILRIFPNGDKRWSFRYTGLAGNRQDYSIGNAGGVGLAEARRARDEARLLLRQGIDPIVARKTKQAPVKTIPTFGEFADQFWEQVKSEWKNPKHRAQWKMTLGDAYCRSLRKLRVDQITSADVLAVLTPIWTEKGETADRLRGRIERVLKAAKIAGHRHGENPASRENIIDALPRRKKLARGHHKALACAELPDFVAKLRDRKALAREALEFTIVTAARSGEVRNATWDEIDLKAKVWTIPAVKMKAGREHRVPLTDGAIEILGRQAKLRTGPKALVFPGTRKDTPLSDMTLAKLVKRMGYDVTVHGFRSTFRDWVYEETEFPRELAEAALAHIVGDATETAYRRGDALERRRKLLEAWEARCRTATTSNDSPAD